MKPIYNNQGKQGVWQKHKDTRYAQTYYTCSLCDRQEYAAQRCPFCPSCGARMEMEKHD